MRYLVTGGCGFVGSHLVEALLREGHEVLILDDLSTGKLENVPASAPGLKMVVGDVAEAQTTARLMAECDGAFHLAAVASVQRCTEDWSATHRVNMGGTVAVYEAAARARRADGRARPVVAASSAAIYGDGGAAALREEAPARPLSAYGADKYALELQGAVAARVHGIPVSAMRFFNVFGPRQDPASPYSGVLTLFARRLARGEPLTIHGDGGQTRDFVHVADVAAACAAAMEAMQFEAAEGRAAEARTYNVCSGESVSVRRAAELLARLSGAAARLEFGPPRAGDIRHSLGDPSRLERELGIRASTDFETALTASAAFQAASAPTPAEGEAAALRAAG